MLEITGDHSMLSYLCPFPILFLVKVLVQKDSSDALFTPKMDIFKQTIPNTAYI